jgi:CNT family concentrative nucleoside transporter
MNKTMRLSGAESLAAAANVFIGQTEAPLVVKPYLERMTKSEINCLMTGGMATIAGGVFGAYMAMLGGSTMEGKQLFGMHLLTASIISAPAAIVAAKMLFPEINREKIDKNISVPRNEAGSNVLDALSGGTTDGVKLAVNVGAMLLAFMAFIYLANSIFYEFGKWTNLNGVIATKTNGTYDGCTLQYVFGLLFSPIAWLLGVPGADIVAVGQMLGEKTILNEFFAYITLTDMKNAATISTKSIIIATYALCGFANFASIGIQIGGIGAIAPGQRKTLSQLGIRALIGGTIACLFTATIAGVLVRGL